MKVFKASDYVDGVTGASKSATPTDTRDPKDNVWLVIKQSAIRTLATDRVILRLEKHFAKFQCRAMVSSILRNPQNQLRIIIEGCNARGIPTNFKSDDVDVKADNGEYVWQDAWSKVLAKGFVVNPPRAAVCKYDYISASSGNNLKGKIIQPSPHFTGLAFDIEGGANLQKIVNIVKGAVEFEAALGIRNYVIERENNCLHVNVFA